MRQNKALPFVVTAARWQRCVDVDGRAMRGSVAALSRALELSEGYDALEFDGIAKATKSIAGAR